MGAGSVVREDKPPFHAWPYNPTRIFRRIETTMCQTSFVEIKLIEKNWYEHDVMRERNVAYNNI